MGLRLRIRKGKIMRSEIQTVLEECRETGTKAIVYINGGIAQVFKIGAMLQPAAEAAPYAPAEPVESNEERVAREVRERMNVAMAARVAKATELDSVNSELIKINVKIHSGDVTMEDINSLRTLTLRRVELENELNALLQVASAIDECENSYDECEESDW